MKKYSLLHINVLTIDAIIFLFFPSKINFPRIRVTTLNIARETRCWLHAFKRDERIRILKKIKPQWRGNDAKVV